MQVEAKDKAVRRHRKAKGSSKGSRHSSKPAGAPAGDSDGGREQQHSSPSKAQQDDKQQHSTTDHPAAPDGAVRHGRSSTSGNQIVLSDPAAAFALVATQEFVRVYSIGHAVAADRTTMRKVAMQGSLQFASAVMACGAPALACLLDMEGEIHLQVC